MKRILVANRGEIAVRILRAATVHGYETVAVYADQDVSALHVASADRAVPLHGTTAQETYLDGEKLIAAAHDAGADAIHPGYGFLSESADFAAAVQTAGLTWIGPGPKAIRLLGDKVSARALAQRVGAPLVPGTEGVLASADELSAFAAAHGLPLAIKAAHGGGGRGMRVVREEAELEDAFHAATSEARAAFGRGECFAERYLDRPRHVEAQVVADVHGNVAVLGTRDCSLQRRNQKLIEEAPAPFLPGTVRTQIADSARALCAAAGYVGAGTVEYLLSPDGLLTFLEVNTRLQVEHPVTEESTGFDIVAEQLRIAEGLPLSVTGAGSGGTEGTESQDGGGENGMLPVRAHAFEFRLNAEDPALGFLPTPGVVTLLQAPTGPGIRLDTGVVSGDAVTGAFDSMFAKLVVSGPDRVTALRRARVALAELRVEGIPTVVPFHRAVLDHPDFTADVDSPEGGAEDGGAETEAADRYVGGDVSGAAAADAAGMAFRVHTRWIESEFADELAESEYLAASLAFRDTALQRTTIEVDGRPITLRLPTQALGLLGVLTDEARGGGAAAGSGAAGNAGGGSSTGGGDRSGGYDGDHGGSPAGTRSTTDGVLESPVAGSFVRWLAEDGEQVDEGAAVAVIEAMKMETEVQAPVSGVLRRAQFEPGRSVAAGQELGRVES